MRIILAIFALIAAICLAFPSSESFLEVKEKQGAILLQKQSLAYSQSSYLERLSYWKAYTAPEKKDQDNAPKTYYVFYDTDKNGKVTYRKIAPDKKTGLIPLKTIESYAKSHDYEYGTQGVFSTYAIDLEKEKMTLRQTTQYYLKQRAAYAKLQINAAKKALEAEGIKDRGLEAELDALHKSVDKAEFDIAFASEPNEITSAADMLKNDLGKTQIAVKKAYAKCAQKDMELLMAEGEAEKGGEGNSGYFAGAKEGFENANSYFTSQYSSDFLYNIKMLFRWTK